MEKEEIFEKQLNALHGASDKTGISKQGHFLAFSSHFDSHVSIER